MNSSSKASPPLHHNVNKSRQSILIPTSSSTAVLWTRFIFVFPSSSPFDSPCEMTRWLVSPSAGAGEGDGVCRHRAHEVKPQRMRTGQTQNREPGSTPVSEHKCNEWREPDAFFLLYVDGNILSFRGWYTLYKCIQDFVFYGIMKLYLREIIVIWNLIYNINEQMDFWV